jgi:hypothetical protein
MQPMDWALERAVVAGTITAQDALEKALDMDAFAKLPSIANRLPQDA